MSLEKLVNKLLREASILMLHCSLLTALDRDHGIVFRYPKFVLMG